MAIRPQVYLPGLNITTYDVGGGSSSYNTIITSEYDTTANKITKLGTVFSFKVGNFLPYVNGEMGFDDCQEAQYVGASRIVVTYNGMTEIYALLKTYAKYTSGIKMVTPTSCYFNGESTFEAGFNLGDFDKNPSRYYFTFVVGYVSCSCGIEGPALQMRWSTDPNFSTVGYYIANSLSHHTHFNSGSIPWISSYFDLETEEDSSGGSGSIDDEEVIKTGFEEFRFLSKSPIKDQNFIFLVDNNYKLQPLKLLLRK